MSRISRGKTTNWSSLPEPILAALRAGDVNVVVELAIWISAARPIGASDDQVQDCVLGVLLYFRGKHGAARMQSIRDWPAYLAQMVKNESMRRRRAEQRAARLMADRGQFAPTCPFGVSEIVVQRELIALAIRAQAQLPSRQREVWRMHLDSLIEADDAIPILTSNERHRFAVALSSARRRLRSDLRVGRR